MISKGPTCPIYNIITFENSTSIIIAIIVLFLRAGYTQRSFWVNATSNESIVSAGQNHTITGDKFLT